LVERLQIASVVGGIIGLVTTICRLVLRRRRFWWDDACALLSMLFIILHVACIFIDISEPAKAPQSTRIIAYYLSATSFYGVIWFARLSMLFSIIRIDPNHCQRKRLLFVAATFVLAGIFLVGQLYWVCAPDPAWRKFSIPQCPLDTQVVVCQLVSDVVSDCILIVAPLKLFRDILDKVLRHRLMLIFSASIMITIASSVHVVYILRRKLIDNLIAANVEACVSLVVCNLPVFAVAVIRLREGPPKRDDGLETSRLSVEGAETVISMRSY